MKLKKLFQVLVLGGSSLVGAHCGPGGGDPTETGTSGIDGTDPTDGGTLTRDGGPTGGGGGGGPQFW
jgi:hypothetical protein